MAEWILRDVVGPHEGRVTTLADGEVAVGRSAAAALAIADDVVSRRHARFLVGAEILTVQDLGSTNGTFVNGQKIKRARLAGGDHIQIGHCVLRVEPAGVELREIFDCGPCTGSLRDDDPTRMVAFVPKKRSFALDDDVDVVPPKR